MINNFKFCDGHMHLPCLMQSLEKTVKKGLFSGIHAACTCSHSREEFESQEKIAAGFPEIRFIPAFGMHPQMPSLENAAYLESLLMQDRIAAVGEAGFDFFTQEFRDNTTLQEKAWDISLSLACEYKKPLVVHNRKALDRMFSSASRLARLPAVIFHSWPFSPRDAAALLERGVNAYFSFGTSLLRGKRNNILCIQSLPAGRLLFETDSPYQSLTKDGITLPGEIQNVYTRAAELRNVSLEELCAVGMENFIAAFGPASVKNH